MKLRMQDVPESAILKGCLQYLQIRGIMCWRQNTGAQVIGEGKDRRYIRYAFPGCPDIIGHLPGGRALYIEVKARRGTLSQPQREFLARAEADGCVAAVVRSVDELRDVIDMAMEGHRE